MKDLTDDAEPAPMMGIPCPSTTQVHHMNGNALHLKELIAGANLTRAEAAALLYTSLDTIHKWLKPATTANRNPCPRWAVELLAYKTHQKIPPMPADALEATDGLRKRVRIDEPEPEPAPPARKPRKKAAAVEAAA
jgi:hypothetical protein